MNRGLQYLIRGTSSSAGASQCEVRSSATVLGGLSVAG